MLLLDLPVELLINIASHLTEDKDINSLAQCRRSLFQDLNLLLYRHNREFADNSALIWAAQNDAVATIQRAIDAGTNPRLQNLPLLQIAAARGHNRVLKMLIEDCNLGVSEWDIDGSTPLTSAVQKRHPESVKLLLEHGADVDRASAQGRTPLHISAILDEVESASLLIDAGADILLDWQGWTPAIIAAKCGSAKVLELLLDHGAEQVSDELPRGVTALSVAVRGGKTDVVKILLDRGADANFIDDIGSSMLYLAADQGRFELAQLLIEHGAKPEANPRAGSLPLHAAAFFGSTEIVKLLLEHGAEVDTTCGEGMTALHEAIRRKKPEVAKLLIEAGADVKMVNGHGDQPLHIAAERDMAEIIPLLLERGADIAAIQRQGWTPIAVAVDAKSINAAKVLFAHGADGSDSSAKLPLLFCLPRNADDLFALLLEHGVDVRAVDDSGLTALHHATRYGPRVTKLLLDHGADASAVDSTGRTPLWFAALNGFVDGVEMFLAQGVDIEKPNNDGYTPLLVAAEYAPNSATPNCGHIRVVELLLAEGAKMDVKNTTGWGPLMCAAQSGCVELMKMLLKSGKVDINEQDIDGRTVLFAASMLGRTAGVQLLMEQDPKPISNIKDRYGATPLIVAARNGHAEIVSLLLSLPDAPLHETDIFNHDVFYWAARCSVSKVQEMLSPYDPDSGRERIESGQIRQTRYVLDTCFCDVCGRCTTGKSHGLAQACEKCVTGDGLNFLVCAHCQGHGLGCRDKTHEWKPHQCDCIEPMEYDGESLSEIEHELVEYGYVEHDDVEDSDGD